MQRKSSASPGVSLCIAVGRSWISMVSRFEFSPRLRLRADVTWMRHLAQGGRVLLEADECVNKTSGRGEIRLFAEAPSGSVDEEAEWLIFAGLRPYAYVLPELFVWADLAVDELAYEDRGDRHRDPESDLRPTVTDKRVVVLDQQSSCAVLEPRCGRRVVPGVLADGDD
jgi:hypothetical protein